MESFSLKFVCDCLKGYYPFYMFQQLYKLEEAVEVHVDGENIWAAAASGEEQNVMFSYYNDDVALAEKSVEVEFKNIKNLNGVRVECYCLDAEHDCELIKEEIFMGTGFTIYIEMPLYSTYLLKVVNR